MLWHVSNDGCTSISSSRIQGQWSREEKKDPNFYWSLDLSLNDHRSTWLIFTISFDTWRNDLTSSRSSLIPSKSGWHFHSVRFRWISWWSSSLYRSQLSKLFFLSMYTSEISVFLTYMIAISCCPAVRNQTINKETWLFMNICILIVSYMTVIFFVVVTIIWIWSLTALHSIVGMFFSFFTDFLHHCNLIAITKESHTSVCFCATISTSVASTTLLGHSFSLSRLTSDIICFNFVAVKSVAPRWKVDSVTDRDREAQ